MFATLPCDLQSIIWVFCGDLRRALTRYHKFVGLELRCWALVVGHPVRPSELLEHYGFVGADHLKKTLELAYDKTQRERLLEERRQAGRARYTCLPTA